jgi:hypothetical protein
VRLVLCGLTTACALWLASDSFRAQAGAARQGEPGPATLTELTCRIPNAHPPAFLATAARTPDGVQQYTGTIGRRTVTMLLEANAGGDLSGSYSYDRIDQPIQLRGRLAERRLTLTEFGDLREPSKSTGSFEMATAPPSGALRGTWRSPDRTRSLRARFGRMPAAAERRVLFTWERRSQFDGDGSWLGDVDYSPARGELVYLEAPNVVAALDLSSMRRRTLLALGPETRSIPARLGGFLLPGPTRVRHVVVSHAGNSVAFSAGPDDFPDIYVMGMTDTRPTRLTDSMGDFHNGGQTYFYRYWKPKFSPDDRMVLFQNGNGPGPSNRIALVGAAGGPIQTLGEGFAEHAYWSADGTRVCATDGRTSKKIVYAVPSGTATVGALGSADSDRERSCRSIADTASIETCEVPDRHAIFGAAFAQRWVRPDVVINFYDLTLRGRPGYRIEVVQLLN